MLIAIACAKQLESESTANMSLIGREAAKILPFIPCVAGALLTIWGAIRFSLVAPRLPLLAIGAILAITGIAFPIAANKVFPTLRNYHWSLPSLMLLFISRIVGLISFSIAVLRWLPETHKKT